MLRIALLQTNLTSAAKAAFLSDFIAGLKACATQSQAKASARHSSQG